jgi:hypothetical protein
MKAIKFCRCHYWQLVMSRLFPVLLLGFLAGCASPTERQVHWETQRATWKLEQDRLNDIYSSSFERGFLNAWAGGDNGGCVLGNEESTDPDGEFALHRGWTDGNKVGLKARLALERERAEKEQANQEAKPNRP